MRSHDAVTYGRTDKGAPCSTSITDLPLPLLSLFLSIAVTRVPLLPLLMPLQSLVLPLLLVLFLLRMLLLLLLLLPESRSNEMATRNDERAAAVRAMSGTVQREPRFFMSDLGEEPSKRCVAIRLKISQS
ncbi:hypothetical protein PUN28_007718 [Cardiocondyla obscurior]|uniref:Uncharacterized protein n=1 Tax=Cardiocondyla obscurior TaxID=286306 RepID=A0AAW2FUG0_9HYME